MNTGRIEGTATLLPSGNVLVAGGTPDDSVVLSSAEIYDPSSGTWSYTGSMTTARYVDTATLLPSGKVLVAGGCICAAPISNVELYDPVAGTWSAAASMAVDREDASATLLLNGIVLVAGGYQEGVPGQLSSAEIYQ